MEKIYFYSPAFAITPLNNDNNGFLNTVPLYLNSHIKKVRPDLFNSIAWTKVRMLPVNQERLINEINQLDIDILMLSIYVWNEHHIYSIVKGLKEKLNKPIKIVAGGPCVDPFRNKNYFDEHPEFDYAVYAQGEDAFVSIIDNIVNQKPLTVLSTKNLAWTDSGQMKLSAFEFLRLKEGSPYLESAELLEQIVSDINSDPDYAPYTVWFPYESSKGCPYNCSYCDWTSGLTHKTYHRVFSIEEEIDLLGRLGLTNFELSDANFGQHRQDIEIIKTMVKLKEQKGYQFRKFIGSNHSKLKIDENFKILELLFESEISDNAVFALQDIDPVVLKNISRPSVPWETLLDYLLPIKRKYPNILYYSELIKGLPGQTRASWEDTLIKTSEHLLTGVHPWIILPGSPAGYDPEYVKTMQIVTKPINFGQELVYNVVVETYSYDLKDFAYITLLSDLIIQHETVRNIVDKRLLFDQIKTSEHVESTLDSIVKQFDLPEYNAGINKITSTFLARFYAEYKYPRDFIKQTMQHIYK